MSRSRAGFTLIELLIVVIIIGLLAAIAIPRFQASKGKAYYVSMKSDLRNLMTAEESYMYSNGTYSNNADSLKFSTSNGVQLTITEATTSGWSAVTTHPLAYPHTCAVFMGSAAAVAPATDNGVIECN